jgi:hypothetical protein
MAQGWDRICAHCGNSDGDKVKRIAFNPTFQCECGYIWDGSRAKLLGVWDIGDATDEELHVLAQEIADRMLTNGRAGAT